MNNVTKWLIALPFTFLLAVGLPALIAHDWRWFALDWGTALFTLLTAAMWLIATAFVDVTQPRGARDSANRLIPLGLILAVPVGVADTLWGPARYVPDLVRIVALALSLLAVLLGVSARQALGQAYSPRGAAREGAALVTHGPYRWVRHPMYLATLLWCLGWPLLLRSVPGSLVALVFVLPALRSRIHDEEQALIATFGAAYRDYQARSARLLPFIY